ncbi:acetate--CoA ligase family protein [Streptomyces sp. NPDC058417]|uniref:acetate--CoA ligase family protein n=1 Tax=unclassified Streptomyces TaxID=2593676 RepID=UPI00364932D8
MLGSTHGTLTTGARRARVLACDERPGPAVHGRPADTDELDVSGRPLYADVPDLDRFFRPESVAVIGASDSEGRPNTGVTRQLVDWAERVGARLHPVHPTRVSVFGIPCVPSVAAVPEPVDLAVLLVADPLPVIEELGAAKVRFAVVFASIARCEGVALDGVLVCQMVERGVEMVVGVAHDDLFGPTVTVGLGGVLVEVLRDTAVRVPPFAEEQAHGMLAELRGRALLDGVQGRPPADVDALVEVVLRVQRMALELDDELAELDINPLMVLPRGQGAVALDALALCR